MDNPFVNFFLLDKKVFKINRKTLQNYDLGFAVLFWVN